MKKLPYILAGTQIYTPIYADHILYGFDEPSGTAMRFMPIFPLCRILQ
jgi:hypothetical protein